MHRPILASFLIALAAACGSEVVIEGPVADQTEVPISEGTPGSGGEPGTGCIPCTGGDCGLCKHEGGDIAFRCESAVAPPVDADCEQTTNLFADDNGEFYACWRCSL